MLYPIHEVAYICAVILYTITVFVLGGMFAAWLIRTYRRIEIIAVDPDKGD